MARDDSVLNTGISSVSMAASRLQKKREEQSEKRVEQRLALTPAAEIVQTEIQREIDMISHIDYLQVDDMLTDENFRAELMARKKVIERLVALKNRFNTLLRDNRPERAQDETPGL